MNWPGLNLAVLRDIYDTHKVFMFGAFNCAEYGLVDFGNDIKKAEDKIFGDTFCSRHIIKHEGDGDSDDSDYSDDDDDYFKVDPMKLKSKSTLSPSFLIDDDLFEVFGHIFAASDGVSQLLKCKDANYGIEVFCCVMPKRVISLYDDSAVYKYSIDDVEEWMNLNSVAVLYRKTLKKK